MSKKSEIIYFDENDEVVNEKEKAVRCVIEEYDEKGNLIAETWGYLGKK